jgi:hypothetical protein
MAMAADDFVTDVDANQPGVAFLVTGNIGAVGLDACRMTNLSGDREFA